MLDLKGKTKKQNRTKPPRKPIFILQRGLVVVLRQYLLGTVALHSWDNLFTTLTWGFFGDMSTALRQLLAGLLLCVLGREPAAFSPLLCCQPAGTSSENLE